MDRPPSANRAEQTFIEQLPAHIAVFDCGMRYVAVSQRFLSDMSRLFVTKEFTPAEVIGLSHYHIFPNLPAHWRDVHDRVLRGEELTLQEELLSTANGRMEWARWSMKPWLIEDGHIGGALLFSEVVTGQVEARHALAASEARLRATFENAAVGIAHVDPYLGWIRVNEAFCRILGYTVEELLTKSIQDITHPDDFGEDLINSALMRAGKLDSAEMDKRFFRKDGSIVTCQLTVSCVRKDDGSLNYFVGIVQDITRRKQAEEELRKSEERFRSSLLHSPVPIMLFDECEQVLAISASWLEVSGYSREDICTIEDWTAHAFGELRQNALEGIRLIISTEPDAQPNELMIRTKDGRERLWSFVTSALGTQSDGRRLFITVAHDVTERKLYEEHVRLLMREVNHRANNMLSIVQAIAHQTAAREPTEFVGRFIERIQALAANQNLLVRNEWRGVDVDELVYAQLSPFVDLNGSRIAAAGPKLRLSTSAAQAVGLVLHELATNACKYGALSTEAGQVEILWDLAENDIFAMSWTEREGPPVSAPTRRGFGTVVMEAMMEYSLAGAVDLDFAPSGLTWRLTCPAARSLERRERAHTSGD